MKQFKRIFYILYFTFVVISVVFAFFQEFLVNNLGFSFNQIIFTILPIWAILGILLMLSEWIMENIHIRRLKTRIRDLEKASTTLKAKLFDQEEEIKSSGYRTPTNPQEKGTSTDQNQDII